jgi:hypothetical protein
MNHAYWPSGNLAFDAATEKLHRAREHLHTLKEEIASLSKRNTYAVAVDFDRHSGWWIANARVSEEPPPRLGVIVGEIAYECLSMLNHLTWELAARKVGRTKVFSKQIKSQVQFPVAMSESAFKHNALVARRLVSKAALAVIDGLQPYHRYNLYGAARPDDLTLTAAKLRAGVQPLEIIKELADADKHRVLTTTFATVEFGGVGFTWDSARASGPRVGGFGRSLWVVDGTPLGRIRFENGNEEANVGVDGAPSLDVLFGTDPGRYGRRAGQPLPSRLISHGSLTRCFEWTERAWAEFSPLFPPEPVRLPRRPRT